MHGSIGAFSNQQSEMFKKKFNDLDYCFPNDNQNRKHFPSSRCFSSSPLLLITSPHSSSRDLKQLNTVNITKKRLFASETDLCGYEKKSSINLATLKYYADLLHECIYPNPFIDVQDSDISNLFRVISHPKIKQINEFFFQEKNRDLLNNLPLFLGVDDLKKALLILMSNPEFREFNYNQLRNSIHQLPKNQCLELLPYLDKLCSKYQNNILSLNEKTMRLRSYAKDYQLNRYDLFMNPISVRGRAIRLLTGSDYLFEGLCKRLNQTKDNRDHFHMIMHEYLDGDFTHAFNQLLIKKHRQGVKIRIILCQGGSWQWNKLSPFHSPKESGNVNQLIQAGIDVIIHPYHLGLEHQKGIVYKANGQLGMMVGGGTVCDQTAYPSGGPRSEYERNSLGFIQPFKQDIPEYYDMMLDIQGPPAIIWQNMFLQKWLYLGGQIEATDQALKSDYFSGIYQANIEGLNASNASEDQAQMTVIYNVPVTKANAHTHILHALEKAETSIHIEIPYLLLTDILYCCKKKALEGVSVNYLLPGTSPRIAEKVTNLAMTDWFREQIQIPTVDIRLCNNRYNHGKLITIDLFDSQKAVAIVMTGNFEPILSGGSKGSFVYDTTCLLTDMGSQLQKNIQEIISRDFSDEFSKSLGVKDLEEQTFVETVGARLIHGKFKLFQ